MNTEPNQPDDDFSVIEELTAYLDGELEPDQIQRVESRLGEDSAYLSEMQSLQKTWDLLDALPTTEPGASFTKTTMELVVGEAVRSTKKRRNRGWVWPARILVMLAVPSLLFATAFGVMRTIQNRSNRILIENLSVIENHSRYEAVECDLGFLEKLSAHSLFSDLNIFVKDGDSTIEIQEAAVGELIPLSENDRRTYVESLDVQKKLKLQRKLEDYQKKPDAQRERLVRFDAQLSENENRTRLKSTLDAYYDWLIKIDAGARSDLRDLSADDRIAAIRRIRRDLAWEEFGKDGLAKLPSKEDTEFVLEWCEQVFQLKEKQIRGRLVNAYLESNENQRIGRRSEESIRRSARYVNLNSIVDFLIRRDREFVEGLILDEGQMPILYNMLSSKAQSLLDRRTSAQQRYLILNWVETAIQSQRGISEASLRQFEESLTVQERDKLEKMSREDYIKTLKRMYLESRKSRVSPQGWWEQQLEEMLESPTSPD